MMINCYFYHTVLCSGSIEIILIICVHILTAIPSDTRGPWVTLNSIVFKFDFEDILG